MKNEIIDNQNNKRETQTIQTEMNLNNLQLCETQLVKILLNRVPFTSVYVFCVYCIVFIYVMLP